METLVRASAIFAFICPIFWVIGDLSLVKEQDVSDPLTTILQYVIWLCFLPMIGHCLEWW